MVAFGKHKGERRVLSIFICVLQLWFVYTSFKGRRRTCDFINSQVMRREARARLPAVLTDGPAGVPVQQNPSQEPQPPAPPAPALRLPPRGGSSPSAARPQGGARSRLEGTTGGGGLPRSQLRQKQSQGGEVTSTAANYFKETGGGSGLVLRWEFAERGLWKGDLKAQL